MSPEGREHRDFDSLLARTHYRLRRAYSVKVALERIAGEAVPVVVAGRWLADSGWRAALGAFPALACPPKLLLATTQPDSEQAAEALECARRDVPTHPLDPQDSLACLGAAWPSWKQQLERCAAHQPA